MSSSSPADVLIEMRGDFAKPVSFAELLTENGLSLSEAHAAATKLAAEGSIRLTLYPQSLRQVLDQLENLGLAAHATSDECRKTSVS